MQDNAGCSCVQLSPGPREHQLPRTGADSRAPTPPGTEAHPCSSHARPLQPLRGQAVMGSQLLTQWQKLFLMKPHAALPQVCPFPRVWSVLVAVAHTLKRHGQPLLPRVPLVRPVSVHRGFCELAPFRRTCWLRHTGHRGAAALSVSVGLRLLRLREEHGWAVSLPGAPSPGQPLLPRPYCLRVDQNCSCFFV